MSVDPEVVERLARMETKLDAALSTLNDHETRIRINEQDREDCQQVLRLNKIETRIDGHDTDIEALKTTHSIDEGAERANITHREFALFLIAIVSFALMLWKQFGG